MSNEVDRLISHAVQKCIECQSETPGSTPPLLIGFANLRDDKQKHAIRENSLSIDKIEEQV